VTVGYIVSRPLVCVWWLFGGTKDTGEDQIRLPFYRPRLSKSVVLSAQAATSA